MITQPATPKTGQKPDIRVRGMDAWHPYRNVLIKRATAQNSVRKVGTALGNPNPKKTAWVEAAENRTTKAHRLELNMSRISGIRLIRPIPAGIFCMPVVLNNNVPLSKKNKKRPKSIPEESSAPITGRMFLFRVFINNPALYTLS
jgi:hypothetical protein